MPSAPSLSMSATRALTHSSRASPAGSSLTPRPGLVAAKTRCPRERSSVATAWYAQPPCQAPGTSTKFSVMRTFLRGLGVAPVDHLADETVCGPVQRVVGGPEQLVHPDPGPVLGQQLAGQVRVAEWHPAVGGDEPDLPPQGLLAGERGQLGGRREFGVLGQELGVLARQAV